MTSGHENPPRPAGGALRATVEEALERHERGLVLHALRLLGDLDRARDVVQETFLRLVKSPEVLERDADGIGAWLFTVARNLALDALRKERRMTALPDEQGYTNTPSPSPSPGAELETADSAARALELVERLPGKQAEVVRLKFQQGLTYQEISRRVDVSVGQVGWLLHMAMKALRADLTGSGDANLALGEGARS